MTIDIIPSLLYNAQYKFQYPSKILSQAHIMYIIGKIGKKCPKKNIKSTKNSNNVVVRTRNSWNTFLVWKASCKTFQK
jgi:hypothetical protein